MLCAWQFVYVSRIYFTRILFIRFIFLLKITIKPTWDVILLIDSYIHTHEFRYVPQNYCVKLL